MSAATYRFYTRTDVSPNADARTLVAVLLTLVLAGTATFILMTDGHSPAFAMMAIATGVALLCAIRFSLWCKSASGYLQDAHGLAIIHTDKQIGRIDYADISAIRRHITYSGRIYRIAVTTADDEPIVLTSVSGMRELDETLNVRRPDSATMETERESLTDFMAHYGVWTVWVLSCCALAALAATNRMQERIPLGPERGIPLFGLIPPLMLITSVWSVHRTRGARFSPAREGVIKMPPLARRLLMTAMALSWLMTQIKQR